MVSSRFICDPGGVHEVIAPATALQPPDMHCAVQLKAPERTTAGLKTNETHYSLIHLLDNC